MKISELAEIVDRAMAMGHGDAEVWFENYKIGGQQVYSARLKEERGQIQGWSPSYCLELK